MNKLSSKNKISSRNVSESESATEVSKEIRETLRAQRAVIRKADRMLDEIARKHDLDILPRD